MDMRARSSRIAGEPPDRRPERDMVAGRDRAARSRRVPTTCRQPRMSVATIGTPIAAASIAERGKPSRCEARTKMSIPA